MNVLVRVRPSVNGRLTSGRADSEAFAHILGRAVGHRFEWRELTASQIKLLEGSGFEIRYSDAGLPLGAIAGDFRRVGGSPGAQQAAQPRRALNVITNAVTVPMGDDGGKSTRRPT